MRAAAAGVHPRRILFVSNPFLGHFLPLVPLARQLRTNGHEVVVATEPAFRSAVVEHGIDHVGVGRDLTLDDVLAAMPEILEVPPEEQDEYARPRMFVGLRAHNILDDLGAVMRDFGPDVVVRESAEFASWALAERDGLPHVAVAPGVDESSAQWGRIAAPWFTELGERVGCPDLHARALYRHGVMSFAPAGYADWSDTPTAHLFRPEPLGATDPRDGDVLSAFDDRRPLVYATLGTEFYRRDLMAAIIEAVRAVGAATIATTGSAHDPALVDPGVSVVRVLRWFPQDLVLARARAVVCHGGAGSTFGALRSGVPLVMLPQGADQFGHARRVEELGVGLALAPAQQTAGDIARALAAILEDPRFAAAARHLADETAQLPGIDAAARLAESIGMTR